MAQTEKETPMVNYLGTCPVCGKGQIAEGNTVYRCNYAASMEDKCDFHVFKTYSGAEITPEHIKQIIENGRTESIDFTSQAGKKYKGFLYIDGSEIKMEYDNNNDSLPQLNTPCPICGETVYIFSTGYGCKNIHETDEAGLKKCNLWINKVISQREIRPEEAEQLLQNGKTDFLDGFIDKNGNEFSSRLALNDQGNIVFDSTICKCPKCGGDIKIGKKAYNCTNYKSNGCNFTIWREIGYRKITPEEVKQLCEEKATRVLDGFKNKDGSKTYSAQLILTPDYQVKTL